MVAFCVRGYTRASENDNGKKLLQTCFTSNVKIENIIDTYSKLEELEEFVELVGIVDDPYVKRRISELKCQKLFDRIDKEVMDTNNMFPSGHRRPLLRQKPPIVEITTPTQLHKNTVQNS